MIPCFICGKDASTGWTKGFVPAPDSQKLALCAEHNTPENRLAVAKAWRAMLERDLSVLKGVNAYKTAAPSPQTATVHFTGGGMLSFVCLSCAPTDQGTLCIETPDGARNYIPLQHVRAYSVRPCAPASSPGSRRADAPVAGKPAPPSFPASAVHEGMADEGQGESGASHQTEHPPEANPFTLPPLPGPLELRPERANGPSAPSRGGAASQNADRPAPNHGAERD